MAILIIAGVFPQAFDASGEEAAPAVAELMQRPPLDVKDIEPGIVAFFESFNPALHWLANDDKSAFIERYLLVENREAVGPSLAEDLRASGDEVAVQALVKMHREVDPEGDWPGEAP